MQVEKKSLTTAKLTKDYLSKKEIPQLFECLMTGLMYHRPSDHITYLEDCLQSIRKHGVNGLRWDMFLEVHKSPLPPIEPTPREDFRPQPLPDIGHFQLRLDIDASVVFLFGGPGLNKHDICQQLCTSFPNYIHIDVGHLLRERALIEAQKHDSIWKNVQETINKGELVPADFVIETLINELNKHTDRKHFLIGGYPRTTEQREHVERFIGLNRVKFMILIDCEKDVCLRLLADRSPPDGWNNYTEAAIDKRVELYQEKALVVCKYFDEQNKLRLIDGDRQVGEVMKDIHQIFTKELNEAILPHPPSARKDRQSPERVVVTPVHREVTEIPRLTDIAPGDDRNSDLPPFKLILLLGGPGSGKSEVAARVCGLHQSWLHVDVNSMLRGNPDSELAICEENPDFVENWKVNINSLKEVFMSMPEGTEVVILEGYPRDPEQLNEFNIEIGRPDCVILLDSEEDVMHARLGKIYCDTQGVEADKLDNAFRVNHFKNNGLSICRYFDEKSKLNIVSADQDLNHVVSDFERIALEKLRMESSETSGTTVETRDDEEAHAAARKIQASVRGHLTRKRLTKAQTPSDDAEAHAAATKIQASIRGHLTRKKLSKNSSNNQNNNAIIDEDENIDENNGEGDEEDNTNDIDGEGGDVAIEDEDNTNDLNDNEDIGDDNDIDKEEGEIEPGEKKDENEEPAPEEKDDNLDVEDSIEPKVENLLGENGVRTNSQLELKSSYVILLLGGPGSGRKTLGSYIVSKFAISFVHVDQILTNAVESGSEYSEEFQKYLANEECDETPIYAQIRRSLMDCLSVSRVLCVAGFPRTVDQYHRFNSDVCPVSATIYLDVDEDTLKSRLIDPDQPEKYLQDIEAYGVSSPPLLEKLSNSELFSKIDAQQDFDQVSQQVSDIIENFYFMKSEEE